MIAGVILCGGASRRMGQSKALIDFLGEALLCRMIRILSPVCQPLIVAAGPHQALPDLPSDIIISRDQFEFAGPVHGLRAALQCVPTEIKHVFVTGCDMPMLRSDLIRQFTDRVNPGAAVVGTINGRMQTLPAVFPVAETMHCDSTASLKDLLRKLVVIEIPEPTLREYDRDLRSFQPMNTPAELAAALQHANS